MGYLTTSIKRKIFSFFDHQKVSSKYINSLTEYLNTGNVGHTDYLLRERDYEKYIDQAIDALPAKMKKVFLLNKKNHLSYQETADRLNTTPNNVQKHINGALKILKTKLTFIF